MTRSQKLNQIINSLNETSLSLYKFDNLNNDSAGKRVRKTCQEVKVLLQELRIEIQNERNARK